MADYLVQDTSLTAVADAIREKGGTTAPLSFPDGMAKAVRGIQTGGADISLGLTAATVGQTIKVKAVDADGKPTAWEAVDMAGGGGENWALLAEQTLAEAVKVITLNLPSPTKHFIAQIWCPKTAAASDPVYFSLSVNGYNNNLLYYFQAKIPSKIGVTQVTVEAQSVGGNSWAVSAYSNRGAEYGNLSNYNQLAFIPIGIKDSNADTVSSITVTVVTNEETQYFPVDSVLRVWGVTA